MFSEWTERCEGNGLCLWRNSARAGRKRNSRAACGCDRRRAARVCGLSGSPRRRLRPGPGCGRLPGEGQGAGACQPLAPYNPLPRLRQPSLTGNSSPQPSPSHLTLSHGIGRRPSAVPHAGRASGLRRSFRPDGAAISAAPCRACDIRQNGRKHSEPKSITLNKHRRNALPPCMKPDKDKQQKKSRTKCGCVVVTETKNRGTGGKGKAPALPRRLILPNKARWGRDGGPGGKGNTSRASGGVPLPPNKKTALSPVYIPANDISARISSRGTRAQSKAGRSSRGWAGRGRGRQPASQPR